VHKNIKITLHFQVAFLPGIHSAVPSTPQGLDANLHIYVQITILLVIGKYNVMNPTPWELPVWTQHSLPVNKLCSVI
jgi:hypothetical protein